MKILLLGPIHSSFAKNDIEILKQQHQVSLINSSTGQGIKGIWNLIKCTTSALFQVCRQDVVISWFADYASLIPILFAKLLRKKSIVIAGGFDVGYQPQLNYGAIQRPIRWFCVRNSFLNADLILPVSQYAKEALIRLIPSAVNKQIEVIHNGIITKRFTLPKEENRKIFLTVSQAHSEMEYVLKGSDKFIEIAKANPHESFKLVGLRGAALNAARRDGGNTPNLEIIEGPLDLYKELIPLYQQSFAYLQLSIEESFGVAVVEAMLCGCVPIITPNAALPEISGEYAQIINSDSDITKVLEFAKNADRNYREELSEFAKKYDIKYREQKMLKYLNKLCEK